MKYLVIILLLCSCTRYDEQKTRAVERDTAGGVEFIFDTTVDTIPIDL